jgi:hypothetical protein
MLYQMNFKVNRYEKYGGSTHYLRADSVRARVLLSYTPVSQVHAGARFPHSRSVACVGSVMGKRKRVESSPTVEQLQASLQYARSINSSNHSMIASLHSDIRKRDEQIKQKNDRIASLDQMHKTGRTKVQIPSDENTACQGRYRELQKTYRELHDVHTQMVGKLKNLLQLEVEMNKCHKEQLCRTETLLHTAETKLCAAEAKESMSTTVMKQLLATINTVLDASAPTPADDPLVSGADAVVTYLKMVHQQHGTDRMLAELTATIPPPPKSKKAKTGKPSPKEAILMYHPDKQVGRGVWIQEVCGAVTRLLNAVRV